MNVYGNLDVAALEQLAADPVTEVFTGRVYFNTADLVAKIYDGTSWTSLGSGGGGGGFSWNPPDGDGPVDVEDNGVLVYQFEFGAGEKLSAFLRVPSNYVAGKPITLNLSMYSDLSGSSIGLQTTSYLIHKDNAIDDQTYTHVSTAATPTVVTPKQFMEHIVDVSDGSGQFNSEPAAAGDLVLVNLTRQGAETGPVKFIPSTTQGSFT